MFVCMKVQYANSVRVHPHRLSRDLRRKNEMIEKSQQMSCIVWNPTNADGSTHCDIVTTLARDFYNDLVAQKLPSSCPPLSKVYSCFIYEDLFVQVFPGINFKYSLQKSFDYS